MTEMDYAAIVSMNLRRIANNAGKTQADICHDLKIGKSTVSSWFTGDRTPRMDKIDMLCRYFGVSRADIMEPHAAEPGAEPLTVDEVRFIKAYRRLDEYHRRVIQKMAATLAEESDQ